MTVVEYELLIQYMSDEHIPYNANMDRKLAAFSDKEWKEFNDRVRTSNPSK